jgi:hypothetical protein
MFNIYRHYQIPTKSVQWFSDYNIPTHTTRSLSVPFIRFLQEIYNTVSKPNDINLGSVSSNVEENSVKRMNYTTRRYIPEENTLRQHAAVWIW